MWTNKQLIDKIPEVHKKAWILGGIGSAIAAGLGWHWFGSDRNYLFIAITIILGTTLGWFVAILFNKKLVLTSLVRVETKIDLVLAVLSFLLTIAGVIGFVRTGEKIGIVGALFFALCGVYLIVRCRAKTNAPPYR